MKPGLLSYTTIGVFCLFSAVLTMAVPILPPPLHASGLAPRMVLDEAPTTSSAINPRVQPDSTVSTAGVRAESPLNAVKKMKKKVGFLDHVDEIPYTIVEEKDEPSLVKEDQQLNRFQLNVRVRKAQKEWISPHNLLEDEHQVPIQTAQTQVEALETKLQTLADLYVADQTFDDRLWSESQITLLTLQGSEIERLLKSKIAPYQQSWILPKMRQALKIFLYPVFKDGMHGRNIQTQAMEQIVHYLRLDKGHLGKKSKWIPCHEFTPEQAGNLLKQVIGRIAIDRAMAEWLSSETPLEHSKIKSLEKRRQKVKEDRTQLLLFAKGERELTDDALSGLQISVLEHHFYSLKTICPLKNGKWSDCSPLIPLQFMLLALKIFQLPLSIEASPSEVKRVAIQRIILYQNQYEKNLDNPGWKKCHEELTRNEAQELRTKVEELIKSLLPAEGDSK
ncbi:hypothetical protein H0H93_002559 [Arthromyces matolae]|nr:hypothetical protein H0H93_002559 [Arthromyces matolae]